MIPVKDDAGFLDASLRSLASQTMIPYEIIVVDNNSSDDSAHVAVLHGVTVLREARPGIAAAAGRGYDHATGDVIARLDADSVTHRRWIEVLVDAFGSRPDIDAFTGSATFTDGPGVLRNLAARAYLGAYFVTASSALSHPPLFGSNFAMRTTAWQSVREGVHSRDTRIHDDFDLSYHLGRAHRIRYLSRMRLGISMRPLLEGGGLLRMTRGFRTVAIHWPDDLPWLRLARRVVRSRRALPTTDSSSTDPSSSDLAPPNLVWQPLRRKESVAAGSEKGEDLPPRPPRRPPINRIEHFLSDYPMNGDAESRTPLYDQTGFEPPVTTPPTVTDSPSAHASDKAGVARDQAADVAGDAKDAAGHVAGVTKEQAGQVASEVKSQAKDLYAQATSELKDQAGTQAQKVSEGLRSLSDELSSMAEKSDGNGVASELVRTVSDRAGSAASWLDGRAPGTLLDDVKSFAARKPGTFIAIAAGAGILAGRLAKSLAAEAKSDTKSTPDVASAAPATEDLFVPASSTYDEYATPAFDHLVDGRTRTERPLGDQR